MECEAEIRCVAQLEEKLANIVFPIEEVAPEAVQEWLEIFSKSRGTTRELFLLSALASTSALIGKTTVEVFGSYEEKGNLFFIAVAPSGVGKSPACHHGCIDPIVEHLEPKIEKSIVLDEASASGLFNHFVSGETVPILCIDEAHSFLAKLSSSWKSAQVNLTMERLCKCFDGDCWYILKGSKAKRSGVSSARAAMIAYTTPRQFLEKVWPRMLESENGLTERILFYYQKRSPRDLEKMAEVSERLDDFPVKSIKVVLEQIYADHNSDADPIKYKLNASAREAFFKFAKPQENDGEIATHGVSCQPTKRCYNSKRNKHVLRVALNLHVFYDRLKKALDHHTGPTSRQIDLPTMNMAIAMVDALETYKGISEICCQLKPNDVMIKVGIPKEDVTKRVLKMPGPFTTARRVYTSFSSQSRPTAAVVQTSMEALQEVGLGKFKLVNKLKVFYKTAPLVHLQPKLAVYGISFEEYDAMFAKQDERLTSRVQDDIIEQHPDNDDNIDGQAINGNNVAGGS